MSQADDEAICKNPGKKPGVDETGADGKHQFSIAALLVLQLVAAVLALVTKAVGPELAIAGVLVFVVIAIPIAGTIWVAGNFQQAHHLGKKFGLASMVIYALGAVVSYVAMWLYG